MHAGGAQGDEDESCVVVLSGMVRIIIKNSFYMVFRG